MAESPKPELIQKFQPLADFTRPSMPAEETVHNILSTIRQAFHTKEKDAPVIEQSHLDQTKASRLDDIAAPPACQSVIDDMTLTYRDWLADPASARNLQLVVMPAAERESIITAWATENGLPMLPPPDPARLLSMEPAEAPDLSGEGVLVIPDLAVWFLRHERGLGHIRALLKSLATTDRAVLIGCNSWAWTYLKRAVDAHLVLPSPFTFRAFDGLRLYKWLGDLSSEVRDNGRQFRLSSSGKDVFEDEETAQDFFSRLASRSLGVPWIAWQMWRDMISDLHPDPDAEDGEVPDVDDENTFWIAPPSDFILPATHQQDALFSLQALLIHGPLTLDLLGSVLPIVGGTSVLPALLESNFLKTDGTVIRVSPSAYPATRLALSNAGFPLDEF